MKVTYYGHACFSVELQDKKLLFDPFISPNPLASEINIDELEADYVLLSHGHEDHVADAVKLVKNTGAKCVAGYEVYQWLMKQGLEEIYPMNHGGSWNLDFGKVKFVNAVHSSMLPDGSDGGNAGGFVIESEAGCFYYSGDTALTWDMKLIPMTCQKLDFALMPIGDVFTMGIEDAILASNFIECNKVIGLHYDTFDPIKIDHQYAVNAFKEAGKELILMDIGSSKTLK